VKGEPFMEAPFCPPGQVRAVRRARPSRRFRLRIDHPRPTLLDWRFCGDAWIVEQCDGLLALCVGNFPLATIQGSPLDLPSLNQVLDRLRHRFPRRRMRA